MPLFNLSFGILFGVIFYLILAGFIRYPSCKPGWASFSYTLYVTHLPLLFLIFGSFQLKLSRLNDFSLLVFCAVVVLLLCFVAKIVSPVERIKLFKT